MVTKKDLVTAVSLTFCLTTVLFTITPTRSAPGTGEYDPWCDVNDDGVINIFDVVALTSRYGKTGTSITKASVEYDSEWINITDKCGQYFNITHNLNNTDIVVEITGKTAIGGGVHQRNLGGTTQLPGWSKTYGTLDYDEEAHSIIQTSDGGFVFAVFAETGDEPYMELMKTDFAGNLLWESGEFAANSISVIQSSDGGIIDAFTQYYPSNHIVLSKRYSNGNLMWTREYSETNPEGANCVVQTQDGGYAIVGYRESSPSNIDFCIIKTNSSGIQQWSKAYGLTTTDIAYSVVQTGDGGYAIAGVGFANLVRTDQNGTFLWSTNYGGSAYKIARTGDDKYVLAGSRPSGSGDLDFWLAKTDSGGGVLWSKNYGSLGVNEVVKSLVCTYDGGFAVAGTKYYSLLDCDNWFVKTDSNGEMQWSRAFGGYDSEAISSIVQTADGGYMIAGYSRARWYASANDIWLMKTPTQTGITWINTTADTITLYRGATDPYWNFVRVRIWKPKTP